MLKNNEILSDSAGLAQEEPQGQVLRIAAQLKTAIERREASVLDALLARTQFWLYDRPGTLADFLADLARITSDAPDLELFVSKLLKLEISDDKAALSAETQMLWTDETTWEEKEASSVMHLGLARPDKEWTISYLGFVARQATPSPQPLAPAMAQLGMAGYFGDSGMFLPGGNYFGVGTDGPLFGGPAPEATPLPHQATTNLIYQAGDDKTVPLVPVYVPEFVLFDIMKKLMQK